MGFDGYIAKPISQERLAEEIARVLECHDDSSVFPDEARLLKQCADDPVLVQELLALFGEDTPLPIVSYAGLEQEYFCIDHKGIRHAYTCCSAD